MAGSSSLNGPASMGAVFRVKQDRQMVGVLFLTWTEQEDEETLGWEQGPGHKHILHQLTPPRLKAGQQLAYVG